MLELLVLDTVGKQTNFLGSLDRECLKSPLAETGFWIPVEENVIHLSEIPCKGAL